MIELNNIKLGIQFYYLIKSLFDVINVHQVSKLLGIFRIEKLRKNYDINYDINLITNNNNFY